MWWMRHCKAQKKMSCVGACLSHGAPYLVNPTMGVITEVWGLIWSHKMARESNHEDSLCSVACT